MRAHEVLAGEIEKYSPELAQRPRIVVASKVEDDASRARARELSETIGCPVQEISSVMGDGIPALLAAARALVRD